MSYRKPENILQSVVHEYERYFNFKKGEGQ